jgi:hypothetical protein
MVELSGWDIIAHYGYFRDYNRGAKLGWFYTCQYGDWDIKLGFTHG